MMEDKTASCGQAGVGEHGMGTKAAQEPGMSCCCSAQYPAAVGAGKKIHLALDNGITGGRGNEASDCRVTTTRRKRSEVGRAVGNRSGP